MGPYGTIDVLYLRVCLCALLCLLFAACASRAPAPIVDRSDRDSRVSVQSRVDATQANASSRRQTYVVQRGDTLYAIAFRYGLDYRRFAAANRIPRPFTIFPGQRLQLSEAKLASVLPAATPNSDRAASNSPGKGKVPVKPAPQKGPSAASPGAATGTQPSPVRSGTKASAASSGSVASTSIASASQENQAVKKWRWPAKGKLIRGFDGSLHKGIDIAGKRGDPVLATAAGRIVYAGSGIAGYGLMLIVRHNDVYLSAYGHNDALLVGEGDTVRAGQRIAKRGSSGTDSVKLHFEIRRGGRPVDPLKLLPRQ